MKARQIIPISVLVVVLACTATMLGPSQWGKLKRLGKAAMPSPGKGTPTAITSAPTPTRPVIAIGGHQPAFTPTTPVPATPQQAAPAPPAPAVAAGTASPAAPALAPSEQAKFDAADKFVTPAMEASAQDDAAKRTGTYVVQQHLPYEDTGLTVLRGIVFRTASGVNKTISVPVPVRYRSGSIYLDEDRVKELLEVDGQITQILAAIEELRVASSMLAERHNEILTKGVPKESLKAGSFSLPSLGTGSNWRKDVYRDVPQASIKMTPATK